MARQTAPNNSIRASDSKNALVAGSLQDVLHQSLGQPQSLSDVLIGHPRILELPYRTCDGRAADLLPEGLLDVLEGALEFGLISGDEEFSFRLALDYSLIEAAGLYQFQAAPQLP